MNKNLTIYSNFPVISYASEFVDEYITKQMNNFKLEPDQSFLLFLEKLINNHNSYVILQNNILNFNDKSQNLYKQIHMDINMIELNQSVLYFRNEFEKIGPLICVFLDDELNDMIGKGYDPIKLSILRKMIKNNDLKLVGFLSNISSKMIYRINKNQISKDKPQLWIANNTYSKEIETDVDGFIKNLIVNLKNITKTKHTFFHLKFYF